MPAAKIFSKATSDSRSDPLRPQRPVPGNLPKVTPPATADSRNSRCTAGVQARHCIRARRVPARHRDTCTPNRSRRCMHAATCSACSAAKPSVRSCFRPSNDSILILRSKHPARAPSRRIARGAPFVSTPGVLPAPAVINTQRARPLAHLKGPAASMSHVYMTCSPPPPPRPARCSRSIAPPLTATRSQS